MSYNEVRGRYGSKSKKNAPSLLLDDDENQILFNILGHGCSTLCSAVVQLYAADPPTTDQWSKICCGVACFIKDNRQRSYFIRIYSIVQKTMLWSQELYIHFRYKTPCLFFHTFEAEEAQVGLNFSSEDEAFKFKEAVEEKLIERHLRYVEKKKKSNSYEDNNDVQETVSPQPKPDNISKDHNINIPIKTQNSFDGKKSTKDKKEKKKSSKDKKKKGLSKADISGPQFDTFQHVSKIGWDPDKGIVMENLDPAMKDVFKTLGMDENNHNDVDAETVEFIYDFVDTYGGVDAVKAELASRPPSVISLALAPGKNKIGRKQTSKSTARKGLASVPENKSTPPLPTKGSSRPPPPAAPPRDRKNKPMSPSPNSSSGIPAPPPPPAVPSAPPPPPVGVPSGGQALKATPTSASKTSSDGKSELLSAIRSGKTLKSVDSTEENIRIAENPGGIMGLLAKALDGRNAQIHGSDDDSSNESDDSDWD